MASNYVGKSIPGFPQRADDFPDSLQGVEAACVESRMAADTMNSEERAAFPQYNSPNKKKEYLYIRKKFKLCQRYTDGRPDWPEVPKSQISIFRIFKQN